MNPLVSVVLPSYNHAPYVGACVRSALAQDDIALEVIVCDDASTDDSLAVLRAIDDPRVTVIASPVNCGASAAVARGLAVARGEFIARMSSDDISLPGRFATQVRFLRGHPEVDCVFGQPEFINAAGNPLDPVPAPFAGLFTTENKSPAGWLEHFFTRLNCLCLPTAMMRRELIDEVPPIRPLFRHLPDFDFWVRCCCANKQFHVLADKVTGFRLLDGNGNISAPDPVKNAEAQMELLAIWRHYDQPAVLAMLGLPPGPMGRLALAERAMAAGSRTHRAFAVMILLDCPAPDGDGQAEFCLRANRILRGSDVFGLLKARRMEEKCARLRDSAAATAATLEAWRASLPGKWLRRWIERAGSGTRQGGRQ